MSWRKQMESVYPYHLRKKYKSTCLKLQLIVCSSKGYDQKLLRYQVLGFHFLLHRLCVSRCPTKEYFDWREVGRFPQLSQRFFPCSEKEMNTALWEYYALAFVWKVNICTHIQLRSIKKTNLSFSSENKHIKTISKCTESIFGYSLKKRVFWVQSELRSSIRSKVIEVKLTHVKPKICMLSKLHKVSYHDSKLT